jgi:hypothetical protein
MAGLIELPHDVAEEGGCALSGSSYGLHSAEHEPNRIQPSRRDWFHDMMGGAAALIPVQDQHYLEEEHRAIALHP